MLSKGCNVSRASTDQEDEILTCLDWLHTPSAGMLLASDKPISCFSLPTKLECTNLHIAGLSLQEAKP